MPVFFSVGRVLLTYLYYITGLLPFIGFPEDSMQVPLITEDFYKWVYEDQKSCIRKFLVKLL